MADLKLVYKASSKDLAENHLLKLEEVWGKNIQQSFDLGQLIGILYHNISNILK